jgi:hypothetical protein
MARQVVVSREIQPSFKCVKFATKTVDVPIMEHGDSRFS